MKKVIILFAASLSFTSQAQIYTAKTGSTAISFYSKAPLEDIEALNKGASIVLKASTNEIQMSISIQNFKFKNALMEEHFNENYMETEKYPKCIFKGKINETVDYSKEGEINLTVTGTMEMHGVTKDVTINGVLQKVGTELKLSSKFKVKVADYKIKVPSMYVSNIAEEVDVTFATVLEPYQKK